MTQISVNNGLSFANIAQARVLTGISYVGACNISSKISKNEKLNVLTYVIYLAPADMSGYNVCPMATEDCKKACLFGSGRAKIDTSGNIQNARITRTKLFFEERSFFMNWVIAEIKKHKAEAERKGMQFSVRLNGTSDISPLQYKLNGKNILEIFPDVQFYDYTKVYRRIETANKYANYDLTYSFSGSNWNECEEALQNNVRVAVVFEKVPTEYKGYKVINGDETDLRYFDEKNVIVGLKFKKVINKIDISSQKFIVNAQDENCVF